MEDITCLECGGKCDKENPQYDENYTKVEGYYCKECYLINLNI